MNTTPSPLESINDLVRVMIFSVENSVKKAVQALKQHDAFIAGQVIEEDKVINSFEIDIDNATYVFFSHMLTGIEPDSVRYLLSVQKLNPQLERIGDHAVNIAESVVHLAAARYDGSLFTIDDLAEKCIAILHEALGSFIDRTPELAQDLLQRDAPIDVQYTMIIDDLKTALTSAHPTISFDVCFYLARICKELERISDLSMNIAEETIFVCEGQVVKHSRTPCSA